MPRQQHGHTTLVTSSVLLLQVFFFLSSGGHNNYGQAWWMDPTVSLSCQRQRLNRNQCLWPCHYSRNDEASSSHIRFSNDTSSIRCSSRMVDWKDNDNNNLFALPRKSSSPPVVERIFWRGDNDNRPSSTTSTASTTATTRQQHQRRHARSSGSNTTTTNTQTSSSSSSLQRAVEQVHALLDLYQQGLDHHSNYYHDLNNKDVSYHPLASSTSIAPDLVLTALEAVVLQSTDNLSGGWHWLPQLVDRVAQESLNALVPSGLVMDTVWNIVVQQQQQQRDQNGRTHVELVKQHNKDHPHNRTCMSHHPNDDDDSFPAHHPEHILESLVTILYRWYQWALADHMDPPPRSYLLYVLQVVHEYYPSPSDQVPTRLWELYTTAQAFYRKQQKQQHPMPPHWYQWMLAILLRVAPTPIADNHMCHVLRDWMEWSTTTTTMSNSDRSVVDNEGSWSSPLYETSPPEWTDLLQQASLQGRTSTVVWMIRALQQQHQQRNRVNNSISDDTMNCFFVQSLLHSTEAGALYYMERYVLSQDCAVDHLPNNKWNKKAFQMLLQKWSQARLPGSGMRAQAIFERLEELYRMEGNNNNTVSARKDETTSWCPNQECVYWVVMAYLQDHSVSLSHVMDAESFVRHCVAQGYLQQPTHNHTIAVDPTLRMTDLSSPSPCHAVFEPLLRAYASLAHSSHAAMERAEELFRYFLIQHRRGKCTDETPGSHHLQHVLHLFHRHLQQRNTTTERAVTSSSRMETIVDKTLEYYKLISSLQCRNHRKAPVGLPRCNEDEEWTQARRSVIGILARSHQADLGNVAEQLWREVVVSMPFNRDRHPRSRNDCYEMGYLTWCVIQCHCRSLSASSIESAVRVVEEMKHWFLQDSAGTSNVTMTDDACRVRMVEPMYQYIHTAAVANNLEDHSAVHELTQVG